MLSQRIFSAVAGCFFAVLIAGCASLKPQIPDVLLSDLRLLPTEGMEPRFEVTLRVINPNQRNLAISGGSFRLYLQDSRVATGVFSRTVDVPAFGEGIIKADGSGDLLGSVALFRKLMSSTPAAINYELEVTLQVQNSFVPLHINQAGSLDLTGNR